MPGWRVPAGCGGGEGWGQLQGWGLCLRFSLGCHEQSSTEAQGKPKTPLSRPDQRGRQAAPWSLSHLAPLTPAARSPSLRWLCWASATASSSRMYLHCSVLRPPSNQSRGRCIGFSAPQCEEANMSPLQLSSDKTVTGATFRVHTLFNF